ncbi:HNH endonuclease family protein [Campylobacter canadensis]|uniref:DUF262 domain-containing protein n=1 Tax=Campylobacter canadensis TaxID=449520 RepID=A0ABS7WTX5_9BACT|nr:DUF262 domain-containing protein [Campylobacter canadensis]MBZ7987762.1 DUF262 domain-containing protein [Campylobacter canadensis]MBZ7998559.1 DUF262 domain-containing protein [Campylobacter canadensis]
MKIELKNIKIRDIIKGYVNNNEDGVKGYDGKLNIRPKYQREFVYKDKQRNAVIETIFKGFPLNVMYWVKNSDNNYEVLDGQQRTISFCSYVNGDFSIEEKYFHNLTKDLQEKFLDYELFIYICEGEDSEKLDWFRIINIAGEKLTEQELRNAVYSGEWLIDAKQYFSKTSCPAYQTAEKYLKGSAIRQEYLETAIKWISDKEGISIEEYMAKHQHDKSASELWLYFQEVINWVQAMFIKYRKEQKGLDWGILYNKYKDSLKYSPKELEEIISKLMKDDDVTNKSGIYEYILSGKEKFLSIRKFSDNIKSECYEEQKGKCAICKKDFEINKMEADHKKPWSDGGKTIKENCQMLCKDCNREKSNK